MRRQALIVLALWAWLVAPPAHAASWDPDLTWRTLVTEHFRIHFHQGEEQLAEEFSQQVETTYEAVTEQMGWRARMKTDVVLIDPTDRANGYARATPYNAIVIYVTAPQEDSTLSLYQDWGTAIMTHEYTHVLHLETNGGIVAAARAVVGRIASTNDVSPLWMVEGLATFQETRLTPGGRGRSPYVDMILRTAVVDDAWPDLGNMDGIQADPPAGNLRYLFGQDFLQHVADHHGEDVWTRWTHAYGRSVPWGLFLIPPKRVFGKRIQGLYRDWKTDRKAEFGAEIAAIEAEGVREGRLISDGVASCEAPSFAPDDSLIVWACNDRRTGNALWKAEGDGSGAEKIKQDFGAKNFTWRPDASAFVFAATHIVNRFNTWSDIYLHDVASGKNKALTSGARARDPDLSPDGSQLVMVTNKAQESALEILTIDQQRRVLVRGRDHAQFATPRWAPDGETLAIAIWEHGRRDLWLMSAEGERLRRLTADVANDRDPWWSADGKWLYFGSDRSGVPNIYAIEIATERLWQVTNVRTGAARPSVNPQNTRLVYEQYSEDGFDVRLMDLDPADFLDRGRLPQPLTGAPALADLVGPPADRPTAVADWPGVDEGRVRPGAPVVLDPVAAGRAAVAFAPDAGQRFDPIGAGMARPQDQGGIDTYQQAEVDDAFGDEEDFPFTLEPKRYDPAINLLPRYWLPTFGFTPPLPGPAPNAVSQGFASLPPPFAIGGFRVGASTGATDVLSRHSWSAFAYYRSDANDAGGGAAYVLNRWLPVFSFSARTDISPYTYLAAGPAVGLDADGSLRLRSSDVRTFFMRSASGRLGFNYPWTPRSTVFASYDFTWRTARDPLDVNAFPETVALQGTIGTLTAGYQYAWGQPTAYAVAPEDARTLVVSGTLTGPFLGTFAEGDTGDPWALSQLLVSLDWREYVVNPLAPNHVFLLKGGAGIAFGGADRFLGNFQLGGNGLGVPRGIRGYPFGAARGDSYWLVGGAYRMPLVRIDQGFGTVPLFLRYLSGEVFIEAGTAFDQVTDVVDAFDDTLVGVGVELRLNAFALWATVAELRVGYAVGLTGDGYWFDDPRTVYVLLDTGF